MSFKVDYRIQESSFLLGSWPLSQVYLKNDANFPWVILVPRVENIQEICQLEQSQSYRLMDEIMTLSKIMNDFFQPTKLNVGSLGNIVTQLHVHIVARFLTDKLWPQGIWQPGLLSVSYAENVSASLTEQLIKKITSAFIGHNDVSGGLGTPFH